MTIDLVIRNARILDGSGAPAFEGDVEVDEGLIRAVGSAPGSDAREELDARGLTLAPGFVDVHAHDDGAFLRHPNMGFKLAQGVTTCVCGNCGFSAIPAAAGVDRAEAGGGILGAEGDFTDLEGYFDAVLAAAPAINEMMLVGHNTVRATVMGFEQRTPTRGELDRMRAMVRDAMEQGACGLSTGLIYRPGRWSQTDEVIELAREAAPFGGLYATHMRNEADHLLEAVDETLLIGREARVHAHISHHKASGRRNWGKVKDSLARVDAARAAGQAVTLDVYPYTAGSGRMVEYFDLAAIDGDLAEVMRIASCPAFPAFEGRMVRDIAVERGASAAETVRLILTAPRGEATLCIQFTLDEADVETNLGRPDVMVGSDGIPQLEGKPHPRLFGTFPRVLAEYVRRRGVLSLPEAVRRMTSLPAETFGLLGRGRIAPGEHADLVLFDPASVADLATYDDPKRPPAGIALVVVNGQVACRGAVPTGARAGQTLRYRRDAYSTS